MVSLICFVFFAVFWDTILLRILLTPGLSFKSMGIYRKLFLQVRSPHLDVWTKSWTTQKGGEGRAICSFFICVGKMVGEMSVRKIEGCIDSKQQVKIIQQEMGV